MIGNLKNGVFLDGSDGSSGTSAPSDPGGTTAPSDPGPSTLGGAPGSLEQDRVLESGDAGAIASTSDLIVVEQSTKETGDSLVIHEAPVEQPNQLVVQDPEPAVVEPHEHVISEIPENTVHSAEHENAIQNEHILSQHPTDGGESSKDASWTDHIQNNPEYGHENIPGH